MLSWLLVSLFVFVSTTFANPYVERIPANIRRDGGVARMVCSLSRLATTINHPLTVV